MATVNSMGMYMTPGSNGQILLPVQPSFFVYNSGNIVDVTGDGTAYDCVFDTVSVDRSGDFLSSTFTAPVDGVYLFIANITISNTAAGHTEGNVSIVTTSNSFVHYMSPYAAQGTASKVTLRAQALCELSATDTAKVVLTISGGTKTVVFNGAAELYSTFSGALLL